MPSAAEPDDDHDLTRAAIDGDAEARGVLWRQHRSWLAAVLAAHAPRGLEVEDLLQETACAFVRGIAELQAPAALRAWLRTIAVHVAVSAARRQGRRREEPVERAELDLLLGSSGPAHDDGDALRAAIGQLEPDLREALLLRCVRGLSQREIAAALEVPETTVETRLARARRKLRALLADDLPLPARRRIPVSGDREWK
jgi:RNA polymerase sigma-70 factor (ECF subfamily)